jgi:hypothetical protein
VTYPADFAFSPTESNFTGGIRRCDSIIGNTPPINTALARTNKSVQPTNALFLLDKKFKSRIYPINTAVAN